MRSIVYAMQRRFGSEQGLPLADVIIKLHIAFVVHQGTAEVAGEVQAKAPLWQILIQRSLPDMAQ